MSEANESNQEKIPLPEPKLSDKTVDYDWRDPTKPRNPEDDVIVDGWRRRADGAFEKVEDAETEQ
ncbi:hypothetical protein [uncultured Nostoc sp.]|uniref:hypothetical protein n=1 Tax=uncultured Nostoc sp. TaxID=340711 RepID=UPI0035CB2CAC